jgi:dihydroorotate dehydrogenase electron transfer subunit
METAAALERRGLVCRVELATEDGSLGRAERVSDTLRREIRSGDRLAVCGPPAMTAAVWEICRATPGVTAWFSLESAMACGVGSCHGCVVPVMGGGTVRVCREGPVFEGTAIFAPDAGLDADPGAGLVVR